MSGGRWQVDAVEGKRRYAVIGEWGAVSVTEWLQIGGFIAWVSVSLLLS